MAKSLKKIVKKFYNSDAYKNREIMKEFLHKDCELYWNSSKGFMKFDYNGLLDLSDTLSTAYKSLRAEISHLLRDDNFITARYTYYVRTIENPDEELPLAHFITIWELKNGKLYRGYELSQQADDTPANLKSFLTVKE